MCCHAMNRREFLATSAAGAAGLGMLSANSVFAGEIPEWLPDKPFVRHGRALRVQPVLLYNLYQPRPTTSWRPWGGLHTEGDVDQEAGRISSELEALGAKADFSISILPLCRVRNKEQAMQARDSKEYDVMLVYAASDDGDVLEACYSAERNNLLFVRHRSGPVYLWYEIAHCRFLRKGGQNFEVDRYRDPAGMDVHDVVVDEYDELLWKLRALHGVQNFIGKKIVTLGGAAGWCCRLAPQVARDKFKLHMIDVSYEELGRRIKAARADRRLKSLTEKWAKQYLSLPKTTLETEFSFVRNAFLLYVLFKQLMQENGADAFTINDCMGTVMPLAETTACLSLSLLNDEGYMAFCESDFNVIPSGLLLYHIAGRPVFLNDPTFPHHGVVTCAHCTAPRRMDARTYFDSRVMTHFESDYGATPKVDLPSGMEITMVCPDAAQKEWIGFRGRIIASPFYDICRSQYDIAIQGDCEKLLTDMRGFHWMMACGDYSRELAYAAGKIGVEWKRV